MSRRLGSWWVALLLLPAIAGAQSADTSQVSYAAALSSYPEDLTRGAFARLLFASHGGVWSGVCDRDLEPAPRDVAGIVLSPVGSCSDAATLKVAGPTGRRSSVAICTVTTIPQLDFARCSRRVRLGGWVDADFVFASTPPASRVRWTGDPVSFDPVVLEKLAMAFLAVPGVRSHCAETSKCDRADVELARATAFLEGRPLAEMRFRADRRGCTPEDGPPPTHCSGVWFAVRPDGSVERLPLRDPWQKDLVVDFDPVMAADFDGNGSIEILFWLTSYDDDGFVLVFDDLRRSAEATWNYH